MGTYPRVFKNNPTIDPGNDLESVPRIDPGNVLERFWERSDLSRLQFLIACSMQNGGGRTSHVREGRCDGAVPDEESRGP